SPTARSLSRSSCVVPVPYLYHLLFFFFNDTPPTDIYTLSLHDALPIFLDHSLFLYGSNMGNSNLHDNYPLPEVLVGGANGAHIGDRKSTRLNSSHVAISYAVFCLKKKTPPITAR